MVGDTVIWSWVTVAWSAFGIEVLELFLLQVCI